jgi:DNA-binding winged helix-turn-helix (wHTH) protein
MYHHPMTQRVLVGVASPSQSVEIARAFGAAGLLPTVAYDADQLCEFARRDNFRLAVTASDLDPGARLLTQLGASAVSVRVYLAAPHEMVPPDVHAVVPLSTGASELVTRAQALLRLGGRRDGNHTLRYGPVEVDLARRELRWFGQRQAVTPIQLRILAALVEAQGAVLTRRELEDAVWNDAPADNGERLVAHMRRLRRKFAEATGHHGVLVTVRGQGYRLAAEDEIAA